MQEQRGYPPEKASLPMKRTVRGVEVRRAPIGQWIAASDALAQVLPDVIGMISGLSKQPGGVTVAALIALAVQRGPAYLVSLASALTGVEEARLRDDPEVGLDGLLEILDAWVEINRAEDFTRAVAALVRGTPATAGDSRDSSPPGSESGSESGSSLKISSLTSLTTSLRLGWTSASRKESAKAAGAS